MLHAVPVLPLLQTAIASADSGPSLGAWIGYSVGGIALVGAIYRLGMNTADTRNLKTTVSDALASMNEKLDSIATYIEGTQTQRVADAEWKGDINSRLGTVEREMGEVRESVHKVRNTASEARALADAAERRAGPTDRRSS